MHFWFEAKISAGYVRNAKKEKRSCRTSISSMVNSISTWCHYLPASEEELILKCTIWKFKRPQLITKPNKNIQETQKNPFINVTTDLQKLKINFQHIEATGTGADASTKRTKQEKNETRFSQTQTPINYMNRETHSSMFGMSKLNTSPCWVNVGTTSTTWDAVSRYRMAVIDYKYRTIINMNK